MAENQTDSADAERISAILRGTGLLGCGCCVDSDAYDADGCPRDEDGWVEHEFSGDCIHEVGRAGYLARALVAAGVVLPPE